MSLLTSFTIFILTVTSCVRFPNPVEILLVKALLRFKDLFQELRSLSDDVYSATHSYSTIHTSLSYRFDNMTLHVESANSGVINRAIRIITGKKDSLMVYEKLRKAMHAGYICNRQKRERRMERTFLEVHECALAPERVPLQHRAEYPELQKGR